MLDVSVGQAVAIRWCVSRAASLGHVFGWKQSKGKTVLKQHNNCPRAPTTQTIPSLGPKVYVNMTYFGLFGAPGLWSKFKRPHCQSAAMAGADTTPEGQCILTLGEPIGYCAQDCHAGLRTSGYS